VAIVLGQPRRQLAVVFAKWVMASLGVFDGSPLKWSGRLSARAGAAVPSPAAAQRGYCGFKGGDYE